MHRTLKKEAIKPAAANFLQQQVYRKADLQSKLRLL
jgi:hypothetical protein